LSDGDEWHCIFFLSPNFRLNVLERIRTVFETKNIRLGFMANTTSTADETISPLGSFIPIASLFAMGILVICAVGARKRRSVAAASE